jgi:two-component system NtrC family sensor kinase
MKHLFKLFLLMCLPLFSSAQKHYTDSLKHALSIAKTDSARFSTLGDLAYYYAAADLKTGFKYVDERIAIARRNNKPLDESSSLLMKGYMMMLSSKYIESFQYLEQALKIAEDPNNENKGWYRGNYYNPAKNRADMIANVHLSWGELMDATGNTPEALYQFNETVKYAQDAGDKGLVAWGQQGLAVTYFYMSGKTDSALVLIKKALPVIEHDSKQLFGNIGIKKYLGETDELIADVYAAKHNRQLFLYYLHKGIYDGITQVDINDLSGCYAELAEYYLRKKNTDSSLYYSAKELDASRQGNQNNLSGGLSDLYQSYKLSGQADSAAKYAALAIVAKDSVNQASQQNLADFQKKMFNEQLQLGNQEKERITVEDRNKTIAFILGILVIMLFAIVFYRNNKRTKIANKTLFEQKEEIQHTLVQLKGTQQQLIQSEKMASLGELTAGIAHEIQNPLNFVNNFSEVSNELMDEMKEELDKGDIDEAKFIADDIKQNLEKINQHGKRAEAIVKGMLQHSQQTKGVKELTNMNALCDEYLRLSYHGLRAKDKSINVEFKTDFDENAGSINIVRQDLGKALLNIINNAFYAAHEMQKAMGEEYKPLVIIQTKKSGGSIEIMVSDNGAGIPPNIINKIFQPFFTTKPTGQGTGLGLSLAYDIITKEHSGTLTVESVEGKGSGFVIAIPYN